MYQDKYEIKMKNIVKMKKYQNTETFLPINIGSVCSIYFWAWTTIAGIEQNKIKFFKSKIYFNKHTYHIFIL